MKSARMSEAALRYRSVVSASFSRYAERIARARALLPALLGGDRGESLAGWNQLLAERRGALGPQVQPAGWLALGRRPLWQ